MTRGSVEELLAALRSVLEADGRSNIDVDVDLGSLTTYRVGGRAPVSVVAGSVDALIAVMRTAADFNLPTLMIGRGSNMLVSDSGFSGVVVRLGSFSESFAVEPGSVEDEATCLVGAGLALPVVARRTASLGLGGFEWAVGVPGSVGGAVRMNAGGHGSDMAATLSSVEILDTSTSSVDSHKPADLALGFRSSRLSDHEIVLSAELRLVKTDVSESTARVDEIVRWRREHQPGGQNCGSVFVNPVPGEVSAGELVDGLGLRGFRIGSAEVSTRHANFIQADPGGSADDVLAVIAEVHRRVLEATGYDLRTEVRLVGFGDDDGVRVSG